MSESPLKTTPLYQEHVRRGARMIPFGGWLMPVQYTSIVDEHQAVRKHIGMFDISHMGQFVVARTGARAWLNTMLTNNLDKLAVGMGQYTFLLNGDGGIIDDLIAYRLSDETFLLVVNAARSEEDFDWLTKHKPNAFSLTNRSAGFGGIAIQGPRVVDLFRDIRRPELDLPARNHIAEFDFNGSRIAVARTGYTGEDGVEVFFPAEDATKIWNFVLEKGERLGIRPCGLGARDTLRLEMCYPLNGSDLTPEHNPIEAGLGFFVDLAKPYFVGREKLQQIKENGPSQKLVPFRMEGKGPPPRPHYSVFHYGEHVGEVTSGTLSPSLNFGIGMAYLSAAQTGIGTKIQIEIRGHKFPAIVEKKPLYKKP